MSNTELIAEARALAGPFLAGGPGRAIGSLLTRLADALETLTREHGELREAVTELQPDPVLVEGSWFERADLPTVLGNFMRSSAEYARQAKERFIERYDGLHAPADRFDNQLRMLLPTEDDRERFREGVLMLAKVGIPAERFENIAYAFARGELTVRDYTRNERDGFGEPCRCYVEPILDDSVQP